MAREDTKWFIVGVVVLSIVLFLGVPIIALIVIDDMKLKEEIRFERKQLKEERKELHELEKRIRESANVTSSRMP
jgi:uncharacterized membrane protein (DUF106 family)